jgi:hypothetical protein
MFGLICAIEWACRKGEWTVEYDDAFDAEVRAHSKAMQVKLAAVAKVLGEFGPLLGRPLVDTLKGSKHANMKELRFKVGREAWRVAFAFDPKRKGILLAGATSRVSAKAASTRS